MSDAGWGWRRARTSGDGVALFKPSRHVPRFAGKDVINPGSLILSGVMMFEHLGWPEAADLIRRGIERTIKQKVITYDLHRQLTGATKVICSQFGKAIIANMPASKYRRQSCCGN